MAETVRYTVLESGIHQFVWLDNSRDAVYQHASYYKEMNEKAVSGETLRLLIDLRQSGAPPFQLLGDANKQSGLRNDIQYRTAYLASDSMVSVLMKNFAIVKRVGGNRQFFKANEDEQAVAWLLNDE